MVIERRLHLGGNVHDFKHSSGIRVHTYGPHYFRTNSERVWDFVNRFASFYPHEAIVKTLVDERYENWPIRRSYLLRHAPDFQVARDVTPKNFEEACLRMMPRLAYEKFVRGYTEKQWGVSAPSLGTQLALRIEVREDDDPRLSRHRFQGLPRGGYATFVHSMLGNIRVLRGVDFLAHRRHFSVRKMLIYTGSIDEFFDFAFGHLVYRAQRREHTFIESTDFAQPCGQVNNPGSGNGGHVRTIEWKHMMPAELVPYTPGTLLTREYPFTPACPDNFEYPFPDAANRIIYQKYAAKAAAIKGLLVCGRLGEYKYYDMDQAIARALVLAGRLLKSA